MSAILFEKRDHFATIQFNRPKAMNCFDEEMSIELEKITEQIRGDNEIRAVMLSGAGKLFMAGGDINFFYQQLDNMPAPVPAVISRLNRSIVNLMKMPKPVLASVHGSVAGVGMSFMMASDLVIAAQETKFTMAYGGLGISPDGGASFNLPRLIGSKKAMQLCMLNELINADTAKAYGLVNWVVPADALQQESKKLLQKLVSGPTQALAATKKLINDSWGMSLEDHLKLEAQAFEHCSATKDFKRGVTAFIAKQKPEFIGE